MPDSITPSAADAGNQPPPAESPGNLLSLGDELDRSLREAFKEGGAKPNESETLPDPQPEPKKRDEEPKKPVSDGKKPDISSPKPPPASKAADDEPPVDPETIQAPKNISPAMLQGWNLLKKNNTRSWNALNRATEENKRLQTALAERATLTNAEVDKLKKETEELRGYRAMVDYEHDPEFLEKYEKPANGMKNHMIQMLQGVGVRQDVIGSIDFSDPGVISRVSRVLAEKADDVTANRFLKRGEEFIDLLDKRNEALQEHKGNYKEFFEQRRKKAESSATEDAARMQKRVEDVTALKREDGNPLAPYLVKHEVPAGATKEQIAMIENHNKVVDTMQGHLGNILKRGSPEERAEIAVGAVSAAWFAAQLKAAMAKVKSLEEALKKYNDISSDRGAGGGGDGGYKPPESLELDDALDSAFPGQNRHI